MDTSQHHAEPPLPELDDPQASLLRVAQLLYAAASAAEQINVSHAVDQELDDQLIEFELKTVLWEALSLLPPGLRLDRGERSDNDAGDRRSDLQSTLRAAAMNLRRGPLAVVPAGTSALLTDLTRLIARLDASQRSQTSGRSPQ